MVDPSYGPTLPFVDIRTRFHEAAVQADSAGVMFYIPGGNSNMFFTWEEMKELMIWHELEGQRTELELNGTFSVTIDSYPAHKAALPNSVKVLHFLPKGV